MIYTCYEMVRDCRANQAEGWSYFVVNYVPAIRKLLTHYYPERAGDSELLGRVLLRLRDPQSSLFQSLEPAPERWFLAELRQALLAAVESDTATAAPEIVIDLETLSAALDRLTVVEKQVTWLETMRYSPAETASMLRMDAKTVEKIRSKAAQLIREKADNWRSTLLADNAASLRQSAGASHSKDCLPAKAFLDVLDGRTTWRGREEMEQHAIRCWYCVDHFCRIAEVVELLRGLHPLSEAEAAPLRSLLGVQVEKPPAWKRWLRGA
ncbi:MAG TPA: hypothetical protein VG675_15055 [Bryobacteraceae bacterium]|nr:hypothetical protein [Bryobacteraceae bacterium]